MDWPFAMLLPSITHQPVYELANNHVWRTEFAFRKWNTRAPAYIRPPFGAGEGGHREWIDYTMGMYYTLLNLSREIPPSAGTANGVHPVPAGFGRVYVHLPDGFSLESWMRGLKSGRSFVTTGPMLYATVNGKDPGHRFEVFRGVSTVRLAGEVISEQPLSYGEVLFNGRPIQLIRPSNSKTGDGAFRSVLDLPVKLNSTGWIAVRFWEPRPDGQSRFVHSAPWYVGESGKLRGEERDYLTNRMRNEIKRSQDVVSEEALSEYRQAELFYGMDEDLEEGLIFRRLANPISNRKTVGSTT